MLFRSATKGAGIDYFTGVVAQGIITADQLQLLGAGDFVLTGNNLVNTLSVGTSGAHLNGDVFFNNSQSLTIGSVTSNRVDGVTVDATTGDSSVVHSSPVSVGALLLAGKKFDVALSAGDLTVAQSVLIDNNVSAHTGKVSLVANNGKVVETGAAIVRAAYLNVGGGSGHVSTLNNANLVDYLSGSFSTTTNTGLEFRNDHGLQIDRTIIDNRRTARVSDGVTTYSNGNTVQADVTTSGITATGGNVVLFVNANDASGVTPAVSGGNLVQAGNTVGDIKAAGLLVHAEDGHVVLENTTNDVDTLTAKLDAAGKSFSYRDANALTIGTGID